MVRFLERLKCWKRINEPIHLEPRLGVDEEKRKTENVVENNTTGQYALVLHNLGRSHGKVHAVHNVNLTIEKGK